MYMFKLHVKKKNAFFLTVQFNITLNYANSMYKSYSTKTICFINMMHGCTWYYFFYIKLVTCMYELHI